MQHLIPNPMQPAEVALLVTIVTVAAAFDLRSRRVPNWLAVTGLLAGLGFNAVGGGVSGFVGAAAGFGLAFAIYFGLYLLHAMGAGDVKLMAAVGAITGPRWWLIIFLATSLVGAILAILLALSKGRLKSTLFNTGFIARELASFRAPWLTRAQLDVKSQEALRLPHAVSIALGAFAALAFASFTARP